MTLKNQFQKLKENWLLLAIVVVVLVAFSGLNPVATYNKSSMAESANLDAARSYAAGGFVPSYEDFSPEAEQRFITKTASLSTEIERGSFSKTDSKIKDLTEGFDAIITNENQNKNGEGRKSYLSSSYTIKVETSKYDALLTQLRQISEVTYFNENADDITKQKLDLETTLEAERERLARFKQLFGEVSTTQEKIGLTDKIFNQERTIKYYEEALENVNNRVSYSTIHLTVTEKRSDFANVATITLSQIAANFVDSINALINLVIVIIPWAIALLIILIAYKRFKR